MKKRLSFVIALAVICTFIFGCKKDKEEPIDILTSKTWKWAAVDKNPSTNPKGKIMYFENTGCLKDDVIYFYATGNYEIKNPDSRCSMMLDGFRKNTFNISSNEFSFGSDRLGTIAEVSKKQVKIYFPIRLYVVPDGAMPDYLVMILE